MLFNHHHTRSTSLAADQGLDTSSHPRCCNTANHFLTDTANTVDRYNSTAGYFAGTAGRTANCTDRCIADCCSRCIAIRYTCYRFSIAANHTADIDRRNFNQLGNASLQDTDSNLLTIPRLVARPTNHL